MKHLTFAEIRHMETGVSELDQAIDDLWKRVRQSNLYGGRPRNSVSEESVAAARSALTLAQDSGDRRFLREAWCMMAWALNANEQPAESLIYSRQAIPALEQAGEFERAARMRLGFMVALSTTGQSKEALAVAREAQEFFRKSGDDTSLAKVATNLGAVYQRLDDHTRGFQCHLEAAELFRKTGEERGLAQACLNLGNALTVLDRFSEAEKMYEDCDEIATRLTLDDLRAHAIYNKAYLYFVSGRLSQSLTVYRDARQMFSGSGSRLHAALCDLDEAEIYVQLRLPQDALILAQSAARSFAELDMPHEQGKAIAFGAVALTQKRQFGDALAAFKEAQTVLRTGGSMFWMAQLDLYRAEVLFSIGRLWEAYSLASAADGKFEELGYSTKRLITLVLLGRVSMALGRPDEAEFHARRVEELAGQTKISVFLFACYALSAEVAEGERQFERARVLYERAAREIELRHTHLHHDELGITFYKDKAGVFESLVYLALDCGDGSEPAAQAFTWCEKAKSQVFIDALAPHLPTVRSKADEALITRVDRLRAELNGSYMRFRPEFLATPGLPQDAQVELREDELARTLNELSRSDSEYVSLQVASSVRLEELQQALPEDTTVLEYFFARDEVMAFVISASTFHVVRHVTPTKRVQFLAGRLQYQLERFSALIRNKKSDVSIQRAATDDLLRNFYSELIQPVMPFINTSGLIIVPHGVLHRVPFHAFFDGERYVADLFDVSYAPSASVLKYCLDRQDVTEKAPLHAVTRPAASLVASFVHTEARVALRQDNPVLSRLEFADGASCVPDIYAAQWQTNLLSICSAETSMNGSADVDGFLGLLRSCLYAGCRSVLMELWKVRPEPSVRFFDLFYSEWPAAGKSRQEALSIAQECLRREFPHPLDWAQFILAGAR
ncbi:MAG TPA: CHAT domain-containing protein [Terriglobia bacterium]|jgi:CHAT domain-containing protein/tetratricopeptide (TPR) repeat protein